MPQHQGFGGDLTLSREELEKWVAHLAENGVESSGIVESPFGLHLQAKDPDGIAIEFFAAAQG